MPRNPAEEGKPVCLAVHSLLGELTPPCHFNAASLDALALCFYFISIKMDDQQAIDDLVQFPFYRLAIRVDPVFSNIIGTTVDGEF
ncbi:hypothetical protein J2Y48_004799 [Mycoplana sp. BE70]|uniref:hypothetical protein n=1 Tax=Mycoplana sp. BE70 TaxID=2817775 RepID=UPI00285B5ADF|nr:hypothetical protein [Mycoplana sp. BE70]MDR6759483.1 hypothetical protein [Mycoplana sp. BE70]